MTPQLRDDPLYDVTSSAAAQSPFVSTTLSHPPLPGATTCSCLGRDGAEESVSRVEG